MDECKKLCYSKKNKRRIKFFRKIINEFCIPLGKSVLTGPRWEIEIFTKDGNFHQKHWKTETILAEEIDLLNQIFWLRLEVYVKKTQLKHKLFPANWNEKKFFKKFRLHYEIGQIWGIFISKFCILTHLSSFSDFPTHQTLISNNPSQPWICYPKLFIRRKF